MSSTTPQFEIPTDMRKMTEQSMEQARTEAVPEGVVGIDNEGCIVVLNIRMASMFGFNREELIGKPIETLVRRRFRAGHSGFRQAFALFPRNRPMGVGRDFFGQRQRRQRGR